MVTSTFGWLLIAVVHLGASTMDGGRGMPHGAWLHGRDIIGPRVGLAVCPDARRMGAWRPGV